MTMVNPPHMSFNDQDVNPNEWELVYRSCIVRLGKDASGVWPGLYENNAHGSAGIIGVTIDSTTRDLVVETDFNPATEKILSAVANVDHQLTAKQIFVGASGGSNITRYAIRASMAHPGYPVGDQIRPNAGFFNPELDNLWIQQVSMRPKMLG